MAALSTVSLISHVEEWEYTIDVNYGKLGTITVELKLSGYCSAHHLAFKLNVGQAELQYLARISAHYKAVYTCCNRRNFVLANQIGLSPFFTVIVRIWFRCFVDMKSVFFTAFLFLLLFKRYKLAMALPVLPKVDYFTVCNYNMSTRHCNVFWLNSNNFGF